MVSPEGNGRRRRQYSAFAEWGAYAEIMLPLVTATMMVPLQDNKNAHPALQYLHACSPVSRRRATEQLVCTVCVCRAEWSEGRYWNILAYAFSHQDQARLKSTIMRLCWYGWRLYKCTGSGCVVYMVFSSSVGASAYLVPRTPFPSDWKTLQNWYNHESSNFIHDATQALGRVVTYLGASRGVFGLMGAVLMVELDKCRKLGRQLKALARERTLQNVLAVVEGVGSTGNICHIVKMKTVCGEYDGGLHHVVGFLVGGFTCAVLRTGWAHY